jgi:hypothetical protein
MVAEPRASGPTRLEFTYDDAAELRLTGWGQLLGLVLLLVQAIGIGGAHAGPALPER